MAKTYANSYFYNKYPKYQKDMFDFIMHGIEVNKKEKVFDDLRYDVKRRQISDVVLRILDSPNVVLMVHHNRLPLALRVFTAKDIKNDSSNIKVYIDCGDIIKYKSEKEFTYNKGEIDKLISYLLSAMVQIIYYNAESKIVNNNNVMLSAGQAFGSLYAFIIDYIGKISIYAPAIDRAKYIGAKYFFKTIINAPNYDEKAKKVSGLTDREINIVDFSIPDSDYDNIKTFIEATAKLFKTSNITLDLVVEKWMWLYGPGTIFSLELFPALSTMLTDAYVGAYINSQKTIEKVAGQSMVKYTKDVINLAENM